MPPIGEELPEGFREHKFDVYLKMARFWSWGIVSDHFS